MKRVCIVLLMLCQVALGQTKPVVTEEIKSCEDLVEGFCGNLWAPSKLGNMDLQAGATQWPIRLGNTENDIDQSRYIFFDAFRKHFKDLPKDLQEELRQARFLKELNRYLSRKKMRDLAPSDLSKSEFQSGTMTSLENAIFAVAMKRTEKQRPGYIRLSDFDTPKDMNRDYYRNRAIIWSEIFVAVWKSEDSWRRVQNMFLQVRDEYQQLIQEDPVLSPSRKKQALEDLLSVKLVMPGENPAYSKDSYWQDCGISLQNSVYRSSYHELTVCAGDFTSSNPLLTLAHEMGHSFSNVRQLQTYWVRSDYGQSMLALWDRTERGEHFNCNEWDKFKKDFSAQVSSLADYNFENAKALEKFQNKTLRPIPKGEELKKLANRFTRNTVRSEINSRYLENILKPQEILKSGRTVKNERYMNTARNSGDWPRASMALNSDGTQFELFFTEEYLCQKEKNVSEKDALSEAIEQATSMISQTWMMWLRVPGKFSYIQEARDEEFAQDVEEDIVDAMASTVVSRMLKKIPSLTERRNTYLATVASFCDQPSFQQQYPEEVAVLNRYTNRSHSIGQDRRNKLMTPGVRSALECK